jgi:hypothetical protein
VSDGKVQLRFRFTTDDDDDRKDDYLMIYGGYAPVNSRPVLVVYCTLL